MLQLIPTELLQRADEWDAEAKQRRRVSPVDPVADTLTYCAASLRETARQAEAARRTLSTTEYARLHSVSPATVRKWIARGELSAELNDAGDWRIPRTSQRRKVAA
jgi:hypothetical protein